MRRAKSRRQSAAEVDATVAASPLPAPFTAPIDVDLEKVGVEPEPVEPIVEAATVADPELELQRDTTAPNESKGRSRRLLDEASERRDTAAQQSAPREPVMIDLSTDQRPEPAVEILPAAAESNQTIEREVVRPEVVLPGVIGDRKGDSRPEVVDPRRPAAQQKLPEGTRAMRVVTTKMNGRRRWTVDFLVRTPEADGDENDEES